MSDPRVPPPPPPPPLPAEADPRRAGGDVRGVDVWKGIGLGLALSWGLRIPLLGLAYAVGGKGDLPHPALGVVALFLPSAALLAALVWALATHRKSTAIGMAIYAGVGGLILGPVFVGTAIVFVVCGGTSL